MLNTISVPARFQGALRVILDKELLLSNKIIEISAGCWPSAASLWIFL